MTDTLDLADFDRYVAEHGIPEEDYPAAFALWIAEVTGWLVPRFEKVEWEEPPDGPVIEGDDVQDADAPRQLRQLFAGWLMLSPLFPHAFDPHGFPRRAIRMPSRRRASRRPGREDLRLDRLARPKPT